MTRSYDSSRRKQAAQETRQRIIQAALALHWEGVAELAPLAEKAGCSLPTVRKHFPTKEELYRGCTSTFGESLVMPDFEGLAAIDSAEERLTACVSEMCRIHEAMLGYAWFGAHERKASQVLDEVMKSYEGLMDALAELVVTGTKASVPVVRSLLDFLTYRALRHAGNLPPQDARDQLLSTLRPLVLSR